MIIRVTVHDNDFQSIMRGFVHNLYNELTSIPKDLYTKYTLEGPDSDVFDEYIQCSISVDSQWETSFSHFYLKTTYTHLKTTNLLMLAANKNVTKLKTV